MSVPPRWRRLAAAVAAAALVVACDGDSGAEGRADQPTPHATTRPVEPTTRPPAVAALPTERASDQAQDAAADGTGRSARPSEALWAGPLDDLWLALRLTPGEDSDSDPWLVSSGPLSGPGEFSCRPERSEHGWRLAQCVGPDPEFRFTAFMPIDPREGLEVELESLDRDGAERSRATLTRIEQRDEPASSANVSLLWRHGLADQLGAYSDLWVADGLVFAPHFSGAIEVLAARSGQLLAVMDLTSVPPAGDDVSSIVWDVKARNGLLYAATAGRGLLIFDVGDPQNPRLLGQHFVSAGDASPENFSDIHNIFLSPDGNVVYAINTSRPLMDLRLIDVSDPSLPRELSRFRVDVGSPHDINVIELDGRLIAFLNDFEGGLFILDLTDPVPIQILGSISWEGTASHSGWPFRIGDRLFYAHNDEGFDQGLTVLDVTDPASPRVVSEFKTRRGISVHNVEVVEGIAYLSYYIDGLRVLDLREPANPREIGHFDTVPAGDERALIQGAWGVRVQDGIVYLSDIENGIYAFRVDVP